MVTSTERIDEDSQDGNREFLDGLPGITLDGADKMIASLRKKVAPFVQPTSRIAAVPVRRSEADEIRADAVALLVQMGLKPPEAQRGRDQLFPTPEHALRIH